MPNVELEPARRTSPFRKIAIGTWATTYDPQVYGSMLVRMEPALAFIERFRERTGKRLTVTHLMAKVVAVALARIPEANAVLRFGRIYPRKVVSVFLQVVMTDEKTGKPDLSGVTIARADELSLADLVTATEKQVRDVRRNEDKALSKQRGAFSRVPGILLHPILRFVSFLLYTLNLDLSWAGIPKDAFGSVMVTNIGSLGLDQAFAPLVPWSRVPMVIAVGRVADEPVVDDGKVVPGKVMRLSATFDHRFIDGAHAVVLAKVVQEIFADPEKAFPL